MNDSQNRWFSCPTPEQVEGQHITLAYGEGARLSRKMISERIIPRFSAGRCLNEVPGDAAFLETKSSRIAFTSDGFTVTPLFFPGGDIGRLAVFGTVNDLVVAGSTPRWLSLSLIIEDGLLWSILDRILDSIRDAAKVANISIVTGDTKVVPRGCADSIFITTSGVGEVSGAPPSGPATLESGDVLIVSGPIGCHGAAILCARENFEFDPPPVSDCGSVAPPLLALYADRLTPRAIRDATRGGVAAILHEWAVASGKTLTVDERLVPIGNSVKPVCELLGLEALHLANEGTFLLATPPELVEPTLAVLQQFDVSKNAVEIGYVGSRSTSPVTVIRSIGREVSLSEPSGAPLPRIC